MTWMMWGHPQDIGNHKIQLSASHRIPRVVGAPAEHTAAERPSAARRCTLVTRVSCGWVRYLGVQLRLQMKHSLVGGIPTPLTNMKVSWN